MAEEKAIEVSSNRTILSLEQTDKVLNKAQVTESTVKGGKIYNAVLEKVVVGKETLENIFSNYDTKFENIQNLVDEDGVIASFTEAANAINALDGDTKQAVKDLSSEIKNEVAFSQNQSKRFQELREGYDLVISSYDKAKSEYQRISDIINSGIDQETGLPLSQEQFDKLQADLDKNNEIINSTEVYTPKSLTGFLSYMEDKDTALTEIFKNDIYWKNSFQTIKVLETTLTEEDINLGVVKVDSKFIERPTAYMNGLFQHSVEAVKETAVDGYFVEVTLPDDAIVGARFAVIALSPIDSTFPKK